MTKAMPAIAAAPIRGIAVAFAWLLELVELPLLLPVVEELRLEEDLLLLLLLLLWSEDVAAARAAVRGFPVSVPVYVAIVEPLASVVRA
jgi:hypothetical protein